MTQASNERMASLATKRDERDSTTQLAMMKAQFEMLANKGDKSTMTECMAVIQKVIQMSNQMGGGDIGGGVDMVSSAPSTWWQDMLKASMPYLVQSPIFATALAKLVGAATPNVTEMQARVQELDEQGTPPAFQPPQPQFAPAILPRAIQPIQQQQTSVQPIQQQPPAPQGPQGPFEAVYDMEAENTGVPAPATVQEAPLVPATAAPAVEPESTPESRLREYVDAAVKMAYEDFTDGREMDTWAQYAIDNWNADFKAALTAEQDPNNRVGMIKSFCTTETWDKTWNLCLESYQTGQTEADRLAGKTTIMQRFYNGIAKIAAGSAV